MRTRGTIAEGEELDTRIRGYDNEGNASMTNEVRLKQGIVILRMRGSTAEGEELDTRMRRYDDKG